ncbi:MAG: hypothetical protein JO328_17810 [Hyphomicrobiales bacterium]|nr:hypothetical protein [Hyphomicrobiales bacterium]
MSSLEANSIAPAAAVATRIRSAVTSVRALALRVDRVVLAFFLLVVFISAIDPAVGQRTLVSVAAELRGLAPWFLLSVLFAAGAIEFASSELIIASFEDVGWAKTAAAR